jgi:hypothetical protein
MTVYPIRAVAGEASVCATWVSVVGGCHVLALRFISSISTIYAFKTGSTIRSKTDSAFLETFE